MSRVILDVPAEIRMRPSPSRGRGGADLVGRRYLLAGVPVTVTCAYGPGTAPGLRNVTVRYPAGSITVRPFRGLRRPAAARGRGAR